jgi:hypothetical protein
MTGKGIRCMGMGIGSNRLTYLFQYGYLARCPGTRLSYFVDFVHDVLFGGRYGLTGGLVRMEDFPHV